MKMHCFAPHLRILSSEEERPCKNKLLCANLLQNLFLSCVLLVSGKEIGGSSVAIAGSVVPRISSVPMFNFSGLTSHDDEHEKGYHEKERVLSQVPKRSEIRVPQPGKSPTALLDKAKEVRGRRERRQISTSFLSLPQRQRKLGKSFGQQEMLDLYKRFLADYAYKKEWYFAKFIVSSSEQLPICQEFNEDMLLSKVSLFLECLEADALSSNETQNETEQLVSPNMKKPFVIAHFINYNREHDTNLINPHLLINYSPKRPILVLAGNHSIPEILREASMENRMRSNYKWTLVTLRTEAEETQEKSDDDGELGEEAFLIHKIVAFASSNKSLHNVIGTWSQEDGLRIDEAKSHGVYSYDGHRLRVTTVSGPPLVNLQNGIVPSTGRPVLIATGYLPDLLDLVAMVLNFTYTIMTPEDGAFGLVDEYGNWSGMIGMLQRNEADLALMSISYTKTRKTVMNYSPPVEYSSTRLLIRRDWQSAELKWDAFIRPFEWKVWFTIVLLIGLGSITLVVFASFKLFMVTPGESMWLLSTCFLLQGQSEHSTIRVTPYRIAVGTFWILAVFIFACYTARLTSFLAADTEKTPVKDFSEALHTNSWKIGLVKGSSFLEKVKESDAAEMALLWRHIQKDSGVLVNGISDGVTKVYKERYIFFTSELIPSFLIGGNCSYTWLPGKYFPGFGSLGYQKDLPYASAISHILAKIREIGLMRRTFKKWWGIDSTCNSKGTDAFTAISLNEAGSAFLILSVGASLAVLMTVIEHIIVARKDGDGQDSVLLRRYAGKEFETSPVVHESARMRLEEDRAVLWSVREYSLKTKGQFERIRV